jgi:hypothetical protein
MRTRRSLLAALAAGLLVAPLAPGGPAVASPPTAVAAPGAASSHTVSLITGDRITVTGDGNLLVHRSGGRDDVTFLAHRSGGHQYVIPSDALGLVRDGQLDRRLFDVTLLREFGYDDRRDDLPLIVTGRSAPAALEEAAGATDLPAVDGVAAQVDKAGLGELWDDVTDPVGGTDARTLAAGVSTVWLDGLRQPVLDESVPQVGAPAAHAAGLDGTGATVAVLDTGIDGWWSRRTSRRARRTTWTGSATAPMWRRSSPAPAPPPRGSSGAWHPGRACSTARCARSSAARSRGYWPACSGRPSRAPTW